MVPTLPTWKLTLPMVQYPLSHGTDPGLYHGKKVSWENLNSEPPMVLEEFIFTPFFSKGPLYLMSRSTLISFSFIEEKKKIFPWYLLFPNP